MRYLLTALLILIAAPVFAQGGAIGIGTPITFVAPATITGYDLDELSLHPGAGASIRVVLVAKEQSGIKLTFEYPRDCGSFGANAQGVPNPPTCPGRDTSAEIDSLLTALNTVNLTTRSLWRRIFDNLCADFPSRFPGGCTVQ